MGVCVGSEVGTGEGSSVGSRVGIGWGARVGYTVGTWVGLGVCQKHEDWPVVAALPIGHETHDVDFPRDEYCPAGHKSQAAPE